jgi:hypothetical protein
MSLYKGEVFLVWNSSNMQLEVDYVVLIQPFRSLTMCFGTSVTSMSINKFQLGCIFYVLNSNVVGCLSQLVGGKPTLFFHHLFLSNPHSCIIPPPLPLALPPLSLLYRFATI